MPTTPGSSPHGQRHWISGQVADSMAWWTHHRQCAQFPQTWRYGGDRAPLRGVCELGTSSADSMQQKKMNEFNDAGCAV